MARANGEVIIPREVLNGNFIHHARIPNPYAGGTALYRRDDHAGRKHWILHTVTPGKRRDIGLGSFTRVSLFEARVREWALAARPILC